MPTVQTWLHAAYLWLAAIWPPLPYVLLVLATSWLAPWAIRRFWPNAWQWFAGVGNSLIDSLPLPIDPDGSLRKLFGKSFQALPSALFTATAFALVTHVDVWQALKGAAFGVAGPVWHELLKRITTAFGVLPTYHGGAYPAAANAPQKKAASVPPVVSVLLLCLALPLVSGCGLLHAAVPVLADVAVVAQDASNALDVLDSWFTLHRDMLTPAQQATWQTAMAKARGGVDGALRSAHGAQELDAHQEAAAFADFQAAYRDLEGLMAGAKSAHPMAMPRLAEPLAMGLRQ